MLSETHFVVPQKTISQEIRHPKGQYLKAGLSYIAGVHCNPRLISTLRTAASFSATITAAGDTGTSPMHKVCCLQERVDLFKICRVCKVLVQLQRHDSKHMRIQQ